MAEAMEDETAGGTGHGNSMVWRPSGKIMLLCPLFMAAQLVVPLLILRRLSRLEKAVMAERDD